MRAVLVPLGGQTVISGKETSEMGFVSTVVVMGEFSQESYDFTMRLRPTQKLVMTMMIQRVLTMAVFPVEM